MGKKEKLQSLSAAVVVVIGFAVGYWVIIGQCSASLNLADMGRFHRAAHASAYAEMKKSCTGGADWDRVAPAKVYVVIAEKERIILDMGYERKAFVPNGASAVPELRADQGQRIQVKLWNRDIEEGVMMKWHGGWVPCAADDAAGVRTDTIAAGDTFTYDFIAERPGTYWFESRSLQIRSLVVIGRLTVKPKGRTAAG